MTTGDAKLTRLRQSATQRVVPGWFKERFAVAGSEGRGLGYTLGRFGLTDVVSLCARLPEAVSSHSMEEATADLVRFLRNAFVDPATHRPEVLLARCFQTVALPDLPDDLREHARTRLTSPPPQDVRCLTLLGTDGDLAQWCDTRQSVSYRVLPLVSKESVAAAPMVAGLVEQLGLGAERLLDLNQLDAAERNEESLDVFFVPEASGSAQVPAQEFVREHGIRSVLGFGGVLPGGEVFVVVLFSRTPVDADVAAMFRTVAMAAKLALLPAVTAPLFRGGSERTVLAGRAAAARVRALEQMLAVQQQTVAAQGARLEDALRRARLEASTTDTLREVGTSLVADLTLDRVVQSATDAATRLTGADFGAFFYNVVDISGESYMLYTLAGAPLEAFSHYPMPRGTEVFAPTFRGEGPIRSDDITRDPRYGHNAPYHGIPPGHLPVRSYLAVPVVSRTGTVHGGLFFGHPETEVFDERAERLAVGVAAQTAVALDNARLYEQQRTVALELQRSLLQPQPLPVPTGLELAYKYLPGGGGADVGGDWFDVIPLPEGRTAFVIGDVMGRGVQAAAIMGQLRTAVRAYAVLDLPPGELVSRFNELVCQMSEDLIATCIYAVVDRSSRMLTMANAGHPPPAMRRPGGEVLLLDDQLGPPLGVPGGVYREHQVAFGQGTRVLLFTDGLVEHRARAIEDGLEQLRSWLASAQGSLHLLCEDVLAAMLEPAAQDDDVTLLALGNIATDP
jgi:serine phosphatase RsbU (regulator of sigma subunit)